METAVAVIAALLHVDRPAVAAYYVSMVSKLVAVNKQA